jgi:O-antigen ligase
MKPFPSYRIILAILLSLLFFTSFAMSERLMDGLSSAKMFYFSGVSIVVLFTVSLGLLFARKPLTVKLHWLDVSILAFWGYNCIRLAFTPYVSFDNKRFIVLTLLTLLYFVFKWVLQRDDQEKGWTVERKIVITGFLLSGLLQSLFCILQLYDINPWYSSRYFKVVGTFGNPDAVAGYLATVIPFAFGVWQLTPKDEAEVRWIRLLGMVTFLAGIFVLPGTLIRGAWLAVAAGTGFCLVYKYRLWVKLRELFITKWRILAGAFIALLLFSVVMVGLYRLKPDSAYGRLLIWKVTLGMIADAPLFGIGFDRFAVEYNNYQAEYFASGKGTPYDEWVAGNVKQAHNEFLQSVAELGAVGCLLFGLIIWNLFKMKHSINDRHPVLFSQRKMVICRSAISSYLVIALFSFPSHLLPTSISFYFLVSFLSALMKMVNISPNNSLSVAFKVLAGCVLILGSVFVGYLKERISAYMTWHQAEVVGLSGEHTKAAQLFSKLENVLSDDGRFLFSYGAVLATALQYEKAYSVLQRASRRFNDPKLWIALAECQRVMGNEDLWEKSLQHSINMTPNHFYPRYLLAKALFEDGNIVRAKAIARQMLAMKVKVNSSAIKEMRKEMRSLLLIQN